MNKKYSKKFLDSISTHATESDYVYHYTVSKINSDDNSVDMDQLIRSIIRYVQIHEVYFKYNPNFISGVLVFGVIGYETDHITLQKDLGAVVTKYNCTLGFSDRYRYKINHDKK